MRELTLFTLRRDARSLIVWCLSAIALIVLIVAFWPAIRDNPSLTKSFSGLSPSLQQAFGLADLGTAEGYLNGQLYSTALPLLFIAFGIGHGSRAIAGEEEAGTIDLVLATPLRRRDMVAGKAIAILTAMVVIAIACWLSVLISDPIFDVSISAGSVAAATAAVFALGLLYAALALALSGGTGSRSLSIAVASGLAVAGFLYTSIAPFVPALDRHLNLSPFQHAYGHEPIANGVDWGDLALLTGLAIAFAVVAVALFDRRDVH